MDTGGSPTTSSSLHLRYQVFSDRGPVREDNQDAAYADRRILVLADGMGGHPAGDVASCLAIMPFSRLHQGSTSWDVIDLLRAAALRGDDAIAAHVSANPELHGMGTTLTAVLLEGDRLGLLHVGDSRAYLLRDGILHQLSHDDTLVQSLVDDEVIPQAEARFHPQRNIVLRALMGRDARFRLANFEVQERDRLLLCSDGMSDVLSDDTVNEVLAGHDLTGCAERLVRLALHAGAADNVTCIVAEVDATEPQSAPVFAGALTAGIAFLSSGQSWRS